jgi:hypothetical protein
MRRAERSRTLQLRAGVTLGLDSAHVHLDIGARHAAWWIALLCLGRSPAVRAPIGRDRSAGLYEGSLTRTLRSMALPGSEDVTT